MSLHKRASEVFAKIYELPESERMDRLAQECGGDEDLKKEIMELLGFHDDESEDFDSLSESYFGFDAGSLTVDPWIADHLDGYEVIEVIGAGGMGVVYRATQANPQRDVAIKLMKFASSGDLLRRFKLESDALGRLRHPGIAQIYQAGSIETPHGERSFIVMEYVQGPQFLDFISENNLSPEEIAALLARVCDAVEEAHSKGVIHRDLKPANILIDTNADNNPKILDFGVARVLEADVQATTEAGSIVGTLSYMSPEQAEGQSKDIGPQSDVYSLGVIAYRLLSGHLPLELHGLALPQALNVIRIKEPVNLEKANPDVPLDLAIIVNKALSKERIQRYATAAELAADLRRFLAHEPIAARPPSVRYRLSKMIRRNRALVGGLASTFLVLLAGVAISLVLVFQKDEALSREKEAKKLAKQSLDDANEALGREKAAKQLAGRRLDEANAARQDFERLADVRDLSDAVKSAATLQPARPWMIKQLEDWIKKYGKLVDRLPLHEKVLAHLRRKALPYSEEQRRSDHQDSLAKIISLTEKIDMREKQLETEPEGNDRTNIVKYVAAWKKTRKELQAQVKEQASWDFGADIVDQWQHDVLMDLVDDLRAFTREDTGVFHDVKRRLERARSIEQNTVGDHQALWAKVIAEIKNSDTYDNWTLKPQVGLIPLGADPASGLQEFLHYETHKGPMPERDAKGRFTITGDTGIILVLIPPGSDWLGCQKDNPSGNNYDPRARYDEWLHEFTVTEPFFMSKYETTQGQWQRATIDGKNPSIYADGFIGGPMTVAVHAGHPVEAVSLQSCLEVVRRVGLILPSKDQWEYVARAGDDTPWASGVTQVSEIPKYGNVAGQECRGIIPGFEPSIRDAHLVHSPAGAYAPNKFGIHDVLGNVLEWTGSKTEDGTFYARGGSHARNGLRARIAASVQDTPLARNSSLGFRASCALQK